MNKAQLLDAVVADTGVSKGDANRVVDSIFKNISDTLAKKDSFQMLGFGAFSTGVRKARTGRNPQTGEPIEIKESVSVKFKVGKSLKEAVNG